jgi:hypothetical protein
MGLMTNPADPPSAFAAIHYDVPTGWVDVFETTDRLGDRVIVVEWTGVIDHDGNVMDGNRKATGFKFREDGGYLTASKGGRDESSSWL